jgi:uncharacterized protein
MSPRFSTSILDRALEAQQKKREAERLEQLERAKAALEKLSKEVEFKEAYIFGSVTQPRRFLKNSDIDIGFIGLKDRHFFRAMAILSGVLGREVDVIQLEGHRMEARVKKEGILWKKNG